MKHIHVACAIIENGGKVLCAQRSESMSLSLKWEFPGGKIALGESLEECLRRELIEEMGVTIRVGKSLPPSTHHYPNFAVTLYPFVCSIGQEKLFSTNTLLSPGCRQSRSIPLTGPRQICQ